MDLLRNTSPYPWGTKNVQWMGGGGTWEKMSAEAKTAPRQKFTPFWSSYKHEAFWHSSGLKKGWGMSVRWEGGLVDFSLDGDPQSLQRKKRLAFKNTFQLPLLHMNLSGPFPNLLVLLYVLSLTHWDPYSVQHRHFLCTGKTADVFDVFIGISVQIHAGFELH